MSPLLGIACEAVDKAARDLERRVFAPKEVDVVVPPEEFEALHALAVKLGTSEAEALARGWAEIADPPTPPPPAVDHTDGEKIRALTKIYLRGQVRRAEAAILHYVETTREPNFAAFSLLAVIAFTCRGDTVLATQRILDAAERMRSLAAPIEYDVYRALQCRATFFRYWIIRDCRRAIMHGLERTTRNLFESRLQTAVEGEELHALGVLENSRGHFSAAINRFTQAIRHRTRDYENPAPSSLGDHYLGRAVARINEQEFERSQIDLDLAESMAHIGSPLTSARILTRAARLWRFLGERKHARRCLEIAYRTGVDRDVLDFLRESGVREIAKPYLFDPRPLGAGPFVHAF